jgi:ATP-dependent Lon protease
MLTAFLTRELEVLELGHKIQSDIQKEMDKNQREYYLRQQLKAIQDELGEADPTQADVNELREKIEAAKMPPDANKAAMRELDRFGKPGIFGDPDVSGLACHAPVVRNDRR